MIAAWVLVSGGGGEPPVYRVTCPRGRSTKPLATVQANARRRSSPRRCAASAAFLMCLSRDSLRDRSTWLPGPGISSRQRAMLEWVLTHGDSYVYSAQTAGRYEHTWRALRERGLVEDRRTIAEDGRTVIVPRDGAWRVTDAGMRALGLVKRCACGRTYTAAAWRALVLCGHYIDEVEATELRHCVCGSTIAIVIDPETVTHGASQNAPTEGGIA